jgi:uncharacterized membrane protein
VYGSARQLLDLLQTKPDGVQRVVLIDFPHSEMKVGGLRHPRAARRGHRRRARGGVRADHAEPDLRLPRVVPMDKLIPTDWTVDQAMTFIISGGAVSPERIPFTRASAAT